MSPRIRTLLGMGLLSAAVGVAQAQVGSQTTTTTGAPQTTSTTRHVTGTVISVSGNTVVGRTAQGVREYKVPDGFMFQMDGKDIGVADLKPGMKVSATITDTTTVTPVTVTEVRQAEVLDTTGGMLIVRGPKGIRKWTAKDVADYNIKIYREGKEAQVSDFKKGDKITAVIVSHKPPEVASARSIKASATGAPPPASAPAPAAEAAPAPAPAPAPAAEAAPAAAPAHKKLPKTASQVPTVGLLGVLSLASGLALSLRRRRSR